MKMKKLFRLRGIFAACCLMAVFGGCETSDDYRGYVLSGRWFGDLGMMVDGQLAVGSDLEFIPHDRAGCDEGYGYETDYYLGWRGDVEAVGHEFDWTVEADIIHLRFDDPGLDCDIRDYTLPPDYFESYTDGVYSSTRFSLRNYDRYWDDYGYWDYDYSYRNSRAGHLAPDGHLERKPRTV